MIALITVIAGPAAAQTVIRPGQTAQGELTTSDPALDDGSYFDCFQVQTRQGQRLQIDQTSDAFDSYLTIGTGACGNPTSAESDDDGGGGLNSRLVRTGDGGMLTIRVNSLEGGKTGAYRLSVRDLSEGTPTPGTSATPAQRPATLAQASCQRMAEALVAFHESRAGYNQIALSMGQAGNPEITQLQPRVDRVVRWGEANGYRPHEATSADGVLYSSTTGDMLTEFERRCSR
tara:strand:+ start:698 stop:1393 length:696 start_codon:yes stop_codon:yes gene_type:complete